MMRNRLFEKISLLLLLLIGSRCSSFVLLPPSQHRIRSSRLASVPADLESMTVKDLRQLLKDSDLLERGVLSKLKLKKDLIDYLEEKLPSSGSSVEVDSPPSEHVDPRSNQPEQPLSVAVDSASEHIDPPIKQPEQPSPVTPRVRLGGMPQLRTSSKDDMYEHIYNLYPPLREENCTSLGEEDVRQVHHPMLRGANNSDMDIITLGTASCSPGITRGVSCTALRLHWQQRYLPTEKGTKVEQTGFQGGTWLFDAGECTQVSLG